MWLSFIKTELTKITKQVTLSEATGVLDQNTNARLWNYFIVDVLEESPKMAEICSSS